MDESLNALKEISRRYRYLNATLFLLQWDQETMMPPGGVEDRGEQIALVTGLLHEILVGDELGRVLEKLEPYAAELPFDSLDAGLIRYLARQRQRETRIPAEIVEELARESTAAAEVWKEARANNNFRLFRPNLEKLFDLTERMGSHLSASSSPYDGLLDYFEPGITHDRIDQIFSAVRPRLVELVSAIAAHSDRVNGKLIRREVPADKQLAFAREAAAAIGYDFKRGRLDTVTHPFAWGTGKGDSRITTRVVADHPMWCIEGAMHESGHAMHLQNMGDDLARSALASYPSAAIGESQSRLMENMVGRSKAFWVAFFPRLKQAFAPAYDDLTLDDFYRALNACKPSLIRIEADEVTYGLHIMLRFEIEHEVISGRIKVADLPEEWNARMEAYLGIEPTTDSDGVLQDIHWAWGMMGYFPGYLLGSMFAAQLWDALKRDIPDIDDQLMAGKVDTPLRWTAEKVMRHGSMYTFDELAERTVGGFSAEPYLQYLTRKYTEIYGL